LCGPGIYADYFTMKVKNGVVCGLRPMSEAEMNELDPAPNSPPPTNGHGAAPPYPTPTYTNGHGRATAPPAPTVEADYLEAWADAKRMLKASLGDASYNGGLHYAKLVKMEGDKFVIAAPPLICQVLDARLKNTITRALHSAMKYKNMPGNWYIEFVSNEVKKEKV